jgi:antitoxin ParD1/3/4
MMNIPLKPESERFVQDQIKAGGFSTPQDVVQAGLQLLQQQQENLTNVRAKIALGLEQAKRGELLDGEKVFDEIFPSSNGKTAPK